MSQYFIKRGEKIHGPFTTEQVKTGLDSGKLTDADLVSESKSGPWQTLTEQLQETPLAEEAQGSIFLRFKDEISAELASLRERVTSLEEHLAQQPKTGVVQPQMESPSESNASPTEPTQIAHWTVTQESNPLNDEKVFNVYSTAQAGVNTYGDPPWLVLRQTGLSKPVIELFVKYGMYFSDDDLAVTVRIGTQKAVRQQWQGMTDNEGVYFSGNARDFIRAIAQAGRVVIAARPYDENVITATFDCSTLQHEVMEQAPELSNWFI